MRNVQHDKDRGWAWQGNRMLNFRTDDDIYVFVRGACIHNMLYPYLYLSTAQSINQAINPPMWFPMYAFSTCLPIWQYSYICVKYIHTFIHTRMHCMQAGRYAYRRIYMYKKLCVQILWKYITYTVTYVRAYIRTRTHIIVFLPKPFHSYSVHGPTSPWLPGSPPLHCLWQERHSWSSQEQHIANLCEVGPTGLWSSAAVWPCEKRYAKC